MLNNEMQEKGETLNQEKLRLGTLRLEETSLLQVTAENEQLL
jgi:hypothetical protein